VSTQLDRCDRDPFHILLRANEDQEDEEEKRIGQERKGNERRASTRTGAK
jgi:hypothetical protein